jgi:demethylspheroidene O-methyltransferase
MASPLLSQPEQLAFLYEARGASAVLEACAELGVLDRLAGGPVDSTTLARECGIDEEAARLLLAALAKLGLAEADDRGSYLGVADVIAFLELLHRWDGLTEGLRRRPELAEGATPGAQEAFPRTVRPLATLCASAVEPAADHLVGAGGRVLDLGAGAAPWSLALARRGCAVTAVDLAPVLPTTRQAVTAAGCGDRFTFVEGDLFTLTLEEGAFDLVIAGNLCHLFDESDNRRLLNRASRWLAPGGTLAVIDLLANERRGDPVGLALYAIDLMWRTPGGQVYPFSSYAGWLREAGCERVERIELSNTPPVTLVRARRP